MKPRNRYRIIVEAIETSEMQTLEFEIEEHESIFEAVESIRKGSDLLPQEATRLAVGCTYSVQY